MTQTDLPPSFPPRRVAPPRPSASPQWSPPPRPPAGAAPRTPTTRERGARRSRRGWLWTTTVLVLALVGASVWLAYGLMSKPAARSSSGQAVAAAGQPATGQPSGNTEPSGAATGLNPQVTKQFKLAQADAAAQGINLYITSGWRSAADQEQIVQQYITKYGSEQEAHKYVLPPSKSAHVQGNAIDVGDTEGAYWLQEHGATYGFCRTYANEVWHFELIIAPGGTCPAMHTDASWGWQ